MECGFGFRDLVHNYGHFITSVLHNFGRALYADFQEFSLSLIESSDAIHIRIECSMMKLKLSLMQRFLMA